jgi:hypothetical protein
LKIPRYQISYTVIKSAFKISLRCFSNRPGRMMIVMPISPSSVTDIVPLRLASWLYYRPNETPDLSGVFIGE